MKSIVNVHVIKTDFCWQISHEISECTVMCRFIFFNRVYVCPQMSHSKRFWLRWSETWTNSESLVRKTLLHPSKGHLKDGTLAKLLRSSRILHLLTETCLVEYAVWCDLRLGILFWISVDSIWYIHQFFDGISCNERLIFLKFLNSQSKYHMLCRIVAIARVVFRVQHKLRVFLAEHLKIKSKVKR